MVAERNLETARLALARGALTGLGTGGIALLYSWLASTFDEFRATPPAPDWIYALWSACVACGFPLVTWVERRLGPLRARHLLLLALACTAFALLWGYQHTYLTALSQGQSWEVALRRVADAIRSRGWDAGSSGRLLAWCSTLSLPMVVLCLLRRRHAHLVLQTLLPSLLGVGLSVGLRYYSFRQVDANFQISLWSIIYGVPIGSGCASYALAAAFTDRRAALNPSAEGAYPA